VLGQSREISSLDGTIYKVLIDQEAGGKVDRPKFKALLLEAYQQKSDLVLFWHLDRFSREGALATLHYPKKLKDHGVNYTSTHAGRSVMSSSRYWPPSPLKT
jgi:DNA invertase Pin-like site-specific DNA recombinase